MHFKEDGFLHEYKVVKSDQKYHLVHQPEAHAEDNQHILSDSEDVHETVRSSQTLGSEGDAPRQSRSPVKRSTSCQQASAVHTAVVRGSQQDNSRQSVLKSATALRRQKGCDNQKSSIADHAAARHKGSDHLANKPVAAGSGHATHSKGASGQGSVAKRAAAKSKGDSSPAGKSWKQRVSSAIIHAPALSGQLQSRHQSSAPIDPQYLPHEEAGQASSGHTQPQQQQHDNKQSVKNSTNFHDLVNLALVGVAQHKSWSVAAQTGLISAYAQFVHMQQLKAVPVPEDFVKVADSKAAEEGHDEASMDCEAGDMLVNHQPAHQQLGSHDAQLPPATACQVCFKYRFTLSPICWRCICKEFA